MSEYLHRSSWPENPWSKENNDWCGEPMSDATGYNDSDNLPEEDDFDDWFELLTGPEYNLIKRDGLNDRK